jgi:hypothetical protein
MKRPLLVVGLVLVVLAMAAVPALAWYEKPVMDGAYVFPLADNPDLPLGFWAEWTGADAKTIAYDPGTPIPSGYEVLLAFTSGDASKSAVLRETDVFLLSATVTDASGHVVARVSEEQAKAIWSPLYRSASDWYHDWWWSLGRLPDGSYKVTMRERLTAAITYADGTSWAPFKSTSRFAIRVGQ